MSAYSFISSIFNDRLPESQAYRFGFNGKENDNEVKGVGNQQNYGARIFDGRIGRFLSVDPLTAIYPMLTPYQFASNTPIAAIDLDGLERLVVTHGKLDDGTVIKTVRDEAAGDFKQYTAQFGVLIRYTNEALSVGEASFGSMNISTVSGRIARHIAADGRNMSKNEGSERNAFRHALWQATIASRYGEKIAKKIGNAHEGIRLSESADVDFDRPIVNDINTADELVDFLNNEIGREIAANMTGKPSSIDIAREVLKVQKDLGLWTVVKDKDNNVLSIERSKISQEQYNTAMDILNGLDKNGMSPEDYLKVMEEDNYNR